MTFWEQKIAQLRWLLQTQGVEKFLEFAPIHETMLVGNTGYVYDMLERIKINYKLDNLLKEPDFINSKYFLPNTTYLPNTIVQLFHLNYLEYIQDKVVVAGGCGVNHLNTIFEFGGGFGTMCRLIKQLGFRGRYIIFDFPEIIQIQKYYLEKCGMLDNVEFYSEPFDLFDDYSKVDLFIAHQSLSETNPITREIFLNNMGAKNYFISFAQKWENMNNLEYFKEKKFHVSTMPYVGNNLYYGAR